MKKIVFLLAVLSGLILTSCQTTKEVFLKDDGSGSYTTTTDMSGLIGMAKMSVPPEKLKEMGDRAIDTTIAMDKLADALEDLTDAEKSKLKKGNLAFNIDMKTEKFITKMDFPFGNAGEISELDKISSKVVAKFLEKQMKEKAGEMPQGMGDQEMPKASFDDYFDVTTSSGVFERKLNTQKYESLVGEQKQMMQQLASMGVGNSTLIINLPKPVKKTEGKNITVSEDKKKITIETSADDFFANAKDLEFKIEF